MADISATPVLNEKKRVDSVDSIIDEKLADHGSDPLVDMKTAALNDTVGEAYDNVRAIDLGADGKERPIGKPLSFRRPLPAAQHLLSRDRHGLRRAVDLTRG